MWIMEALVLRCHDFAIGIAQIKSGRGLIKLEDTHTATRLKGHPSIPLTTITKYVGVNTVFELLT